MGRGYSSKSGVPNLRGLMLDDLWWSRCNNNRNKVHSKWSTPESSQNHLLPHTVPWEVSPMEPIPGAKRAGDCRSEGLGVWGGALSRTSPGPSSPCSPPRITRPLYSPTSVSTAPSFHQLQPSVGAWPPLPHAYTPPISDSCQQHPPQRSRHQRASAHLPRGPGLTAPCSPSCPHEHLAPPTLWLWPVASWLLYVLVSCPL